VTTKAISLPTKIPSVVEPMANVEPLGIAMVRDIGVCSHPGKAEDSGLVRDVGASDIIYGPSRSIEGDGLASHATGIEERVNVSLTSVCQSLNGQGLRSCRELRGPHGRSIMTVQHQDRRRIRNVQPFMQVGVLVGAMVEDVAE
jgi:hypothetical protein